MFMLPYRLKLDMGTDWKASFWVGLISSSGSKILDSLPLQEEISIERMVEQQKQEKKKNRIERDDGWVAAKIMQLLAIQKQTVMTWRSVDGILKRGNSEKAFEFVSAKGFFSTSLPLARVLDGFDQCY